MADVVDTLDLAHSANDSVLTPGDPQADAILHLLAHMANSDGVIHRGEMDLLATVLPGRSDEALTEWIRDVGGEEPHLEEVARALQTDDMRWTCLRFTARMAWQDGELQEEERTFLQRLCDKLGLPDWAVDRVLLEMKPSQSRFTHAKVLAAVQAVKWDAAQIASGPIATPELAAVAPPSASCVCRIGLDKVEVLGIYDSGMSARFLEGPCYLGWSEIVSYSRGFGLGSAVQIVTESGLVYTLVDQRMTGICPILDLLLGNDQRMKPRTPRPAPKRAPAPSRWEAWQAAVKRASGRVPGDLDAMQRLIDASPRRRSDHIGHDFKGADWDSIEEATARFIRRLWRTASRILTEMPAPPDLTDDLDADISSFQRWAAQRIGTTEDPTRVLVLCRTWGALEAVRGSLAGDYGNDVGIGLVEMRETLPLLDGIQTQGIQGDGRDLEAWNQDLAKRLDGELEAVLAAEPR